ncbi:hypothetical protein NMY22_g19865 [Coprinellus aureogranulatus]|nr:hypothetical protein NMY22_g19865 [Coprinellus aureogranulatus]
MPFAHLLHLVLRYESALGSPFRSPTPSSDPSLCQSLLSSPEYTPQGWPAEIDPISQKISLDSALMITLEVWSNVYGVFAKLETVTR